MKLINVNIKGKFTDAISINAISIKFYYSIVENFMKSLSRFVAVCGVVAGTLWGNVPGQQNMAALALPQQEVIQKLDVPVFAVTDGQGSLLLRSITVPGKDTKASVAPIFITKKDADDFVNKLKAQDANLGNTVKVTIVSLGKVYQISQLDKSRQENLQFAFVPAQQQVDLAEDIQKQNGKTGDFNGVPLFLARGGADNGYLVIQQGNQEVIPMFFSKQDLLNMVENFKKQQPELSGSIKVEVVNLEGVMTALEKDNDPFLKKIVLIPPRDSIEFVQKSGGQ